MEYWQPDFKKKCTFSFPSPSPYFLTTLKKNSDKTMNHFEKVKLMLLDLGHEITAEDADGQLFVINDGNKGICNMIIDCESNIVILEQHIFNLDGSKTEAYKRLLQINRTLVHGAFVLDETGKHVLFRDTLEVETLDKNELESSINALTLSLVENGDEFIALAAKAEKVA